MSRRRWLGALGAGSVGIFAGCLGGSGANAEGPHGTIEVSGSNTVAPITQIVGEEFQRKYEGALVDVQPQGTGAGFQAFCRGFADIQNASREMLDNEEALCMEDDVEFHRYIVGQDALAVGVHEENDWVDHFTLEELYRIWRFEATGEITRWNHIRSEWPDERIHLHGRDSGSGTFDHFTQELTGERGNIRDDYSATSQTDEIWDAISGNRYALGWGAVAHLRSLQGIGGTLRTVPIESDEEPGVFVDPTHEHIESGEYTPLTRSLYAFVNFDRLAEAPDLIGSFMRFYFNNQQELAGGVGFFATSDDEVRDNHERLNGTLEELSVIDDMTEPIDARFE